MKYAVRIVNLVLHLNINFDPSRFLFVIDTAQKALNKIVYLHNIGINIFFFFFSDILLIIVHYFNVT